MTSFRSRVQFLLTINSQQRMLMLAVLFCMVSPWLSSQPGNAKTRGKVELNSKAIELVETKPGG
jgi:hypothetical protein